MEHMICLCQYDPQTFTRAPNTNIDYWLQDYERVSKHKHWEDTTKLVNIVFFLSDTALQWFDNNEETLTYWDAFKEAVTNIFSHTGTYHQQAQERQSLWYPLCSEKCIDDIADTLSLCTCTDPDKTEADKLNHLLKGISEKHFSVAEPQSPATVHDFIPECKTQEDLRGPIVFLLSFQRPLEI